MLPTIRQSFFACLMASTSICNTSYAQNKTSSRPLLGNEIGNGGDVVVCFESENRAFYYEALDSYEAREMRNLSLKLDEFSGQSEGSS